MTGIDVTVRRVTSRTSMRRPLATVATAPLVRFWDWMSQTISPGAKSLVSGGSNSTAAVEPVTVMPAPVAFWMSAWASASRAWRLAVNSKPQSVPGVKAAPERVIGMDRIAESPRNCCMAWDGGRGLGEASIVQPGRMARASERVSNFFIVDVFGGSMMG